MFFVGVISEHRRFELLKKRIQKFDKKNDITLININKDSIENVKSIKFDSILLIDSIEKIDNKTIILDEICKNLNYLIINSDIEIKSDILSNLKVNIITYGVYHKSTVTFSSITDDNILISVQRDFTNKNRKLVEVGEYNINTNGQWRINLHEILVEFIIKKIYILI